MTKIQLEKQIEYLAGMVEWLKRCGHVPLTAIYEGATVYGSHGYGRTIVRRIRPLRGDLYAMVSHVDHSLVESAGWRSRRALQKYLEQTRYTVQTPPTKP